MKTKLTAACLGLGLLLIASCGGGNGDDANGGDGANASGSPRASAGVDAPEVDAKVPDDVDEADEGGVNKPREGTYTYTLTSETTNASTPDAPARTSPPDATWTSTISYEGDDVVVTKDKTSQGSAESTVKRSWEQDAVREISFGTTTEQGEGGCTFDEPVVVLELPIEEGKLPTHEFEGEGANCNGERTITVEGREDATDANGHVWPTWKITVESVTRSTGLTNRQRDTRWFSPDLGKDIRIEGVGEYVNPSGGVAARAETEIVLESYPSA